MNKRIFRISIILMMLVTLLASCNLDVLSHPIEDYDGSAGRPMTKAFFTGAAPADISATQAFYTDKITLMFNVVPGADFYEVYVAKVSRDITDVDVLSLEWKKLDHDISATDGRVVIWNHEIPLQDRTEYRYFYKVRAGSNIDYANNVKEGAFSEVVEGWTLVPPKALHVSQGEYTDKITLSWDSDDYVKGYILYMLKPETTKWSIISSDLIPAPYGIKTLTYDYVVDPSMYGKNIYFRLGSVSLGNKPSDMGVIRSGYTFIKGAPKAPEKLKVSASDFIDKIEVSWDKPRDDNKKPGYQWKIVRYTDTTPEREVLTFNAYEIAKNDKLPTGLEIRDNRYVFTDTVANELAPGEVYKYKVMASAEIELEGELVWAPGIAAIAEGSLLAPPKDISINAVFDAYNPDGRFEFDLKTPFGFKDDRGWKYELYGRYNDGSDVSEFVKLSDTAVAADSTKISYAYDPADKKNEFMFKLNAPQEGKDPLVTSGTDVLYKRILSVDNVQIDDIAIMSNSYKEGLTANGNGVYPVYLTVNNVDAFKTLYIGIDGAEPIAVSMSDIKKNGFAIKSPEKPFETYSYTLSAESYFGRKTAVSKPVVAYGTVTPEKFMKLFEAYILKPWEFAEKADFPAQLKAKWNPSSGTPAGNLHAKIDKQSTESMGYMKVNSDFHDGVLEYDSKMSGLAGDVHFKYKNFGELEGIWGTGGYSMLGMGLNGSGKAVTGNLSVFGMYPANVDFSALGVTSYAFSGNYKVKFANELGDKLIKAVRN